VRSPCWVAGMRCTPALLSDPINPCRYLDQYYTKTHKVPNIYDTGMLSFKNTMFPLVKDDVTTAILELVAEERGGNSIDRGLLKSVVRVRPAFCRCLWTRLGSAHR
jgi:hypothetical protein